MGNNPSSSVNNIDKKTVINKTQIDVINQNISSHIANTLMKSAQSCAASNATSQSIDISNLHADGDVNLDLGQKSDVVLNFSCAQSNSTRTDIAQDLFSQMLNNLNQSNNSEMMGALEAAAKAKLESGFGSWGSGAASSTSNNTVDYTNINDTHMNLQNVVKKSIENNFTSEDIKQCVSNLVGSQQLKAQYISAGGNINLSAKQDATMKSLTNCKQLQDASNNIITKVADVLGVEIINDNKSKGESIMSGKADSDTVAKGPFESIGEGIASAAKGIGEGLSSVLSALTSPWMISGIVSCVMCCICVLVIAFMFMGGSDSNTGNSTQ